MADWDPYYLARGLYRRLPEDRTTRAQFERARELIEKEKQARGEARSELLDLMANAPSAAQAAAFRSRLDHWDAANMEAILDLQEALTAAQDQVRRTLAQAFVLTDGRRVFRTEDGLRVFDEHVIDLSAEIDPDSIEAFRPSWERFQADQQHVEDVEAALAQRLQLQDRLDQAREDLDAGALSVEDLDALDAEFSAAFARPPLQTNQRLLDTQEKTEPGGPAPLPDVLPQATPSPVFQPGW
ncbi:MAG: hypothetical protein AAF679_06890 [Pseudomonadota bacterium]